MLRSLGSPSVQHNFHETNGAADTLFGFGSSITSTSSSPILLSPLDIVAAQLKQDREGAFTNRLISRSSYNKLVSVGNRSVLSSVGTSMFVCQVSTVISNSSSNTTLVSNSSSSTTLVSARNCSTLTVACNSLTL